MADVYLDPMGRLSINMKEPSGSRLQTYQTFTPDILNHTMTDEEIAHCIELTYNELAEIMHTAYEALKDND